MKELKTSTLIKPFKSVSTDIETIFLDMDGVLVDWSKSVCDLVCLDYYAFTSYWEFNHKGNWNMAEVHSSYSGYNITRSTYERVISSEGELFWENLDMFDYAKELVNTSIQLVGPENVMFLTSPMSNVSGCAQGKINWIKKYLGLWGYSKYDRNFIITNHKHYLSKPNNILIDDSTDKVAGFDNYIMVDRPWNTGGVKPLKVVEVLKNEFKFRKT